MIAIGSLAALAPLAKAQDNTPKARPTRPGIPGGGSIQARMKQMAEQLNLTDEQKEKLKNAFADQAEKFKELRENQNLSREEKLAKFREMNEGIEAKLKPILTPEQFEKWQKSRPQPGAQRRRPTGDK